MTAPAGNAEDEALVEALVTAASDDALSLSDGAASRRAAATALAEATAALTSRLASLRAEVRRAQTRHGNDVLIAERDAARSALASARIDGYAAAIDDAEATLKAWADKQTRCSDDKRDDAPASSLAHHEAAQQFYRAAKQVRTLHGVSCSNPREPGEVHCGACAGLSETRTKRLHELESALSRATERGERLAEEMRVALAKLREIPFAATQVFATVAYATCVLGEALAEDARDAAGGEDGR